MRLHFAEFCFDTDRRELSRDGETVHLTAKALQLLEILIAGRPRTLTKEEIQNALWPDTFVEESNLSVLVHTVRNALGDGTKKPRFIKTVHGFGYGFIADVRSDAPVSLIRLRSGCGDFVLRDGENIVGRDAAASVRLPGDGISRRHARITVAGDRLTIEDLGSKNGTYVDGKRIDRTCELRDGNEIRVAGQLLRVFVAAPADSTVTEP